MTDNCCQSFADSYEVSNLPAMQAIERSVLGCDYGGTSWTTTEQAQVAIEKLALAAGDHVLDIGSGSGWPGLFLADKSGCNITLLDLPLNALSKASARAVQDGYDDRVSAVSASGDALPFADGSFDAISHSDVLCCLPEKVRMLRECRRVAGFGARMAFTVIRIAEGLGKTDHDRAIDVGPPFIDAPASYIEMIEESGWMIDEYFDVTDTHRKSLERLVRGLEGSQELMDAIGENVVRDNAERRRTQISAIDEGLMVRETFITRPN